MKVENLNEVDLEFSCQLQYLTLSSEAARRYFLRRASRFPHQAEWRRSLFVKGPGKRLKNVILLRYINQTRERL